MPFTRSRSSPTASLSSSSVRRKAHSHLRPFDRRRGAVPPATPARVAAGGYSLGWGTGGPASVRRIWNDDAAARPEPTDRQRQYPPLAGLRSRTVEEYSRSYIGPLNPLGPGTPLESPNAGSRASNAAGRSSNRCSKISNTKGRSTPRRDDSRSVPRCSREVAVEPEAVIADLFSTTKAPLDGYRRMVWTAAQGDDGHWDRNPERARELFVAARSDGQSPRRFACWCSDADVALRAYRTATSARGRHTRSGEVAVRRTVRPGAGGPSGEELPRRRRSRRYR